jgi:hypothetical protein
VDGNSFEQIAFVKGANNSTRIKNYATSDYKAFEIAQSPRLYYRLKQLDNDGSFTYSSVVLVNRDNMETNDFIVFPNPFVNEFTISLHANQNEVSSIDLLDLQGKLVSKQMIALNQGLNKLPITNLSQVQAGIYFLRVSHNGTVQIKKIVKN